MKITRNEARSGVALGRALKLSALGVLTVSVSALIACGGFDNPTTATPHVGNGGTGGTSTTTTGGSSTTTTGGTSDTTAGTSPVATGGGGTGGDTSVAGTTSTGGTPPATAPFCSPQAMPVQTRAPLPLAVTPVFTPSGYEGGDPGQNGNGQITTADCAARAPGTSIGKCTTITYTPATPATWAGVAYILGYTGFGSTGHAPICLADGATAITFYAKGAVGGEAIGFSGGAATAIDATMTTDWKLYVIPLSGAQYNTDAMGLTDGFFYKFAPAAGATAVAETVSIDDIQYIGGTPGGGGSGGTGGAGGSGGSGGAAAGTGGSGGAAAGSGGTGGA